MNNQTKNWALFLLGAAAGAVAGVLMAPQSGKKTRKLIVGEQNVIPMN